MQNPKEWEDLTSDGFKGVLRNETFHPNFFFLLAFKINNNLPESIYFLEVRVK
jgi:hypothetical protein